MFRVSQNARRYCSPHFALEIITELINIRRGHKASKFRLLRRLAQSLAKNFRDSASALFRLALYPSSVSYKQDTGHRTPDTVAIKCRAYKYIVLPMHRAQKISMRIRVCRATSVNNLYTQGNQFFSIGRISSRARSILVRNKYDISARAAILRSDLSRGRLHIYTVTRIGSSFKNHCFLRKCIQILAISESSMGCRVINVGSEEVLAK